MGGIDAIAPYRWDSNEVDCEARITGRVPEWLEGDLIRTAPALLQHRGWRAEHWFDGLAMLYRFRLAGGVSFRNRFLDTEYRRSVERGVVTRSSFGTRRNPPLLQWLLNPKPTVTDNANVNITRLGDQYLALSDIPHQRLFDPETLQAGPLLEFDDAISGPHSGISHPHFDFERDELISIASTYAPVSVTYLYAMRPGSTARTVLNSWNNDRWTYQHSFCLTKNYAVLIMHPLTVNVIKLLWSRKGKLDHMAWRGQDGTRFVVLPRDGGATTEFEVESFFCFHSINAYEDGNDLVLDLIAHHDGEVVQQLRVAAMQSQPPSIDSAVRRYRLDMKTGKATFDLLCDERLEFGTINYARFNTRRHEFAYATSYRHAASGHDSRLVKLNAGTGATEHYARDGWIFGEPVFVPRPGGAGEDDGVVLAVASHATQSASLLAVIDAGSWQEIATARIDYLVPAGFHGQFFFA